MRKVFKVNIYCHIPREDWIVDRLGLEFKKFSGLNVDISFDLNKNYDIIWLFAGWCWKNIPINILKNHVVVCSVHHIVENKFNTIARNDFITRDNYIDTYLTYNKNTKKFMENLTNKKITILPHWINNFFWKKYEKSFARKRLNIQEDYYLIGSFQRDTEGSDLVSPKLEKGPDIFLKKIIEISKFKKIHILLGGYRRNYIIKHLKINNIGFTYYEKPSLEFINLMYCALDLYVISSREEGGPQSLFESSFLGVPYITTKCGQYNLFSNNCNLYSVDEKITQDKLNDVYNSTEVIQKRSEIYNIKNIVKKYDKYLKNVFNKKRN